MNLKAIILRNTYWIKDYINNCVVGKHYKEIKEILENKDDNGFKIREELLQNLLIHAVAHAKFYSNCNPNSLESFPIINKIIIQENDQDFKVNGIGIPEKPTEIFTHKTSGSTGTPFTLQVDYRKQKRRIAELKYFGTIVGFKSHENLMHLKFDINWQSKTKFQAFTENITSFNMSNLNDARIKELISQLKTKKIVALRSIASVADQLAQYVKKNKVALPDLKIVIAVSEPLFHSTRSLIEKHLGCQIISQYSNQENGILAQQSISEVGVQKNFYLNHASYFFEVLKIDRDEPADYGDVGRIVITDLYNYAQPLIRYDTGDTGIMQAGNSRSKGYSFLSHIYGRRTDLIYDINNNPVNPIEIILHLKYFEDITQYQFIQTGKNEYLLRLKIKIYFKPDEILEKLAMLMGGNQAAIKIEYVDEITVLDSGKRKSVSNEWKA